MPGQFYLISENPAVRRSSACRESVERAGISLIHAPGFKDLIIHSHQGAILGWHCRGHTQGILQVLDAVVSSRPAWTHGSGKNERKGNRRDFIDEKGHFLQRIGAMSHNDTVHPTFRFLRNEACQGEQVSGAESHSRLGDKIKWLNLKLCGQGSLCEQISGSQSGDTRTGRGVADHADGATGSDEEEAWVVLC
jgi:hypothetical protein